jgi:endosialidase-like protein
MKTLHPRLCLAAALSLVLVPPVLHAQLYNTTLGVNTLSHNTTGNYNLALGTNSLYQNTTGNDNTTNGLSCMFNNTTGTFNTAIGFAVLLNNTTASFNSGFGLEALYSNTVGQYNTAEGVYALYSNVSGSYNTANGHQALYSNTTGIQNIATGHQSLYANTTGGNNTAVGYQSLIGCTTGSNNIALGYAAGSAVGIGYYNIDIGNAGTVNDAACMRIGTDGKQLKTFIAGIQGATTGSDTANAVYIDVNGQLGNIISSRRYKEDIHDMGDASSRILSLRPVTFRYKKAYDDGSKPLKYGLIAEEVAETFPDLTIFKDGLPETVKYQDLTPLMLNEFLKEHKRVQEQEAKLSALERTVAEQRKQNEELQARDKEYEARLAKLEQLIPAAPRSGATTADASK